MPELRLQVDESILKSINDNLKAIHQGMKGADSGPLSSGPLSANDIGRDALAVYKWVVEQTLSGRAVVAADKELSELKQITTPYIPARSPQI